MKRRPDDMVTSYPLLAQHMHAILMFQRRSIQNGHTWAQFLKMVDQVMPRKGDTLEIPFNDSSSAIPLLSSQSPPDAPGS
jgi:hypothetical protein